MIPQDDDIFLVGTIKARVDDNRRLTIPRWFRAKMGSPLILTGWGNSHILRIYPMTEWRKVVDGVSDLATRDGSSHAVIHNIVSGAVECAADAYGRITIPARLMEYAGIKKNVLIAGQRAYLEVLGMDIRDALDM